MSQDKVPELGQLAMVRRRPALIREVTKFTDSFTKNTQHILNVEYIDGWNFPSEDTLIWEKEIDARIISHLTLPDVGSPNSQPDPPEKFQAFLDAVKWSTQGKITHLIGLPDIFEPISFTSPWKSAVKIEDYQFYPVLKALLMPRVSLLLADDVGVGKTVEAGLIASELISQRGIRRILIICPASIQEQWQEEMKDKFNLDFVILDSAQVFKIQKTLGMDANPWTTSPRIITSMDYIRQPHILDYFEKGSSRLHPESAAVLPWDLLIVDEAHNLSPSRFGDDSLRCQMLRDISKYCEHRLFLTATPHNGFTVSFTGLLEILNPLRFKRKSFLDEKDHIQICTVLVRRLKSEINEKRAIPQFVNRKVEGIQLNLSNKEMELFEALRRYREKGIQLVSGGEKKEQYLGYFIFSILTKRLLSSSYAFARTWWNHIKGFELEEFGLEEAENSRKRAEMDIPEDEEKERRNSDAVRHGAGWLRKYADELTPFISDVSSILEDMGWTEEATARGAEGIPQFPSDAKWEALVKWIDHTLMLNGRFRDDERLIIFTEYKDTLDYLITRFEKEKGWTQPEIQILFGGAPEMSRSLIKQEFNDPQSQLRILVATDVAAEGLNLQTSCRYVIHQEVPWNPMRLEQRNGRVDRYGQGRNVVVSHFATDEDADIHFLSYVAHKVTQVREDLGSVGQVLDEAVIEHFSGRYIKEENVDHKIDAVITQTPEKEDLGDRDRGSSEDYQKTMQHLEATEMKLGLNEKNLAQLLSQSLQMENGSLKEGEPGIYRIETIPPSWERLITSTLRIQTERLHGALPKIVFDPKYFEVTGNAVPIFRPRNDTVLLRLGHPIMQKAMVVLKRQLWEESGTIKRWTVLQGDLPSGIDIAACLSCTITVRNKLGEVAHATTVEIPFILTRTGMRELDPDLWEEIERLDAFRLTNGQMTRWRPLIHECWLKSIDELKDKLERLREKTEADFTESFSKTYKEQQESLSRDYDERINMIELDKNPRTLEQLQRDLAKTREQYTQMRLTPEREEEALRQFLEARDRYLDAAWEQQHSNNMVLKERLEAEKNRILERVLPSRFTLSSVDVQPIAAKIIVRKGVYT
ncbi:MAG: DEAD/DEAH box helicase family protein [Theionarchaea archaeon]|nr:DEAD/DEAH box helicase family protein [Theionarchaea archaeon]